jgi:hypothetical protein
MRHMNFSFMRRPIVRAAICTRAAYANLRMKRALVFQLEILRDRAAGHAMEIIKNLLMKGIADWSRDPGVPDAQSDGAVHGDHGNPQSEAGTIGEIHVRPACERS